MECDVCQISSAASVNYLPVSPSLTITGQVEFAPEYGWKQGVYSAADLCQCKPEQHRVVSSK